MAFFPTMILGIALVAVTVAAMEAIAALSHRYIMHGWGWAWHRSHHETRRTAFERNDLYALSFATLSVALFALGTRWWPLSWIALGMTLYGVLYFLLHDVLVHRRWGLGWTPRHGYLMRVVKAHRLHHACREREGCVSFGFIWAPPIERLVAQRRELRTQLRTKVHHQ
jgi:beta-carotene 3-hydroxylase